MCLILSSTGGTGEETHTTGQVDGGQADLVEEQVRRNLHQHVRDEKDADGQLELVADEVQVRLEAGQAGGGDVVSVREECSFLSASTSLSVSALSVFMHPLLPCRILRA